MTLSLSEIERLEGLARAATPGLCSMDRFHDAASPAVILSLTQALRESMEREAIASAKPTDQMLEQIAHNLCSIHDFTPDHVKRQEQFARAVIDEFQRAVTDEHKRSTALRTGGDHV